MYTEGIFVFGLYVKFLSSIIVTIFRKSFHYGYNVKFILNIQSY